LIKPSDVIGLHERSRERSEASFGFAASTRHSDAVKKVEFSESSKIWEGQLVRIWSRKVILIGNSFKLNFKLSPPALPKTIASLNRLKYT
jgi:hypothetical protein